MKKWETMGRIVRGVVAVLVIIAMCSGNVGTIFADGGKSPPSKKSTITRYAKEQAFFSDTGVSQKLHLYVKGVLGKGEKVKTLKTEWYNGVAFCQLSKRIPTVKPLRVQRNKTTTQKPKVAYSVKKRYRELTLKKRAKLRTTPCAKADSFRCRDTQVISLGITSNGWYKLFVNGKVGFIRKDSEQIITDRKPISPPLVIDDCFSDTIQSSLRDRIMYFYAMMPERARRVLTERKTVITIEQKFADREDNIVGYATYDGMIHMIKHSSLETTFLHEAGHVLTVYRLKNQELMDYATEKCLPEAKNLPFTDYHCNSVKEHLAESFAYYVLMPQKLKDKAPNTYTLFQKVLGYE